MSFADLPMELFRPILAEAMLIRGLQRALRLRLVNSVFSNEVLGLLPELRMLDSNQEYTRTIGEMGTLYLKRRLLSKQPSLSPRLDNIRRIASRFALEDDGDADNQDSYVNYISVLSSLVTRQGPCRMRDLFVLNVYAKEPSFDYDLLTAAAYTHRLTLVQELSEQEENTELEYGIVRVDFYDRFGTMGTPYAAAALSGNLSIIDHLLHKAEQHGRGPETIRWLLFEFASKIGAPRTVEHLWDAKWMAGLQSENLSVWKLFHDALSTPDLETFEFLMQIKASTPHPTLTKARLAFLAWHAARNGWEEMLVRLLALGAPVDYTDAWIYRAGALLHAACTSGTAAILRHILQHPVTLAGNEIGRSAQCGYFGSVKILIEHGANVNYRATQVGVEIKRLCGDRLAGLPPAPVVSAVLLEHEGLFRCLVQHGALLTGEIGGFLVKEAKARGLESMLALLAEYGVDIA
ncbi:hypothetical protein K504DRAFT_491660 [Pleomassaria siparia CBS 279.74]|uniref:Ankyrin n=1 Tax=Pleomassaria siparia CBS 279.74 TaxID=1314801 RepID=A0A6G1K9B2_9PLEO|nr:hypothetical protein K504DRAFT_491660 [Pleomassaria siparia CBS 279.74]